jgi:secreted trypsin-like serine protease
MLRKIGFLISCIAVPLMATSTMIGCAGQNGNNTNPDQMNTGIIGGSQVADTDDISHSVVGILMLSGSGWSTTAGICSGTLIDNNIIMTAGHCVGDGQSQLYVFFGKEIKMEDATILPVVAQARHPEYVDAEGMMKLSFADRVTVLKDMQKNGGRDIALIRVAGSVPSTYKTLKYLSDTSGLKNGMKVTLAGFGITDATAKPSPKDRSVLHRVDDVPISQVTYNPSDMLIDQRKGFGSCHGDSGGPALITNATTGELEVAGVTSRAVGMGAATCSGFVAYTSTSPFHEWIARAIPELMKVNPASSVIGKKIIPVAVAVAK